MPLGKRGQALPGNELSRDLPLELNAVGKLSGAGNETMAGGDGNDSMYGEAGSDLMAGGAGNDVLSGGADNDFLYGEGGDDFILGGEGDDQIIGGAGVDGLFGEAGNDTFVFDVAVSVLDVIFDGAFGPGATDQVVIQNGGAIDTFAELIDNASQDGADVVVAFNATTGIYIKNHTIAQLAPDDFLFAA
jgi:Ca2+-binding RTX toxin-like protein